MTKYKVTRTWVVDAEDMDDAVIKTRNWKHEDIHIQKIPDGEVRDIVTNEVIHNPVECKEPWGKDEEVKIVSEHPLVVILNPNLPKYVPHNPYPPFTDYYEDG